MAQKEELEQKLRSLSDTYKHKRKQMKQLEDDLRNMEEAYTSLTSDERSYEQLIAEKLNAIIQTEKDIEQLKEKLERAAKQLINYSRDLRRTKGTDAPTIEEKDFQLRDLWDFNKNKAKELYDLAKQYPLLEQTLNILFAQANIPVPTPGSSSVSGSSRSSRNSTRRNSASSSSTQSTVQSERGSSRNVPRQVNIGFDLPPPGTGRSGSKSGTPKSSASSNRQNQ